MKKTSKQLPVLFATAILLASTVLSPLAQANETSSSSSSSESSVTTSKSSSVASTTQSQPSEAISDSSTSNTNEPSSTSEETPKTEAASSEAHVTTSEFTTVANIGQIQGEAHESPYNGKKVKVSNVVVTKTDRYGFYVQDLKADGNAKTSDAIYVVSKEKVAVGDQLTIEGQIKEGYMEELSVRPGQTFRKPTDSLTVTQLFASKVAKDGTATLPAPVNISDRMPKDIVDNTPTTYDPEHDALDYWESLEGMLTTVKKPRVLGPQYRGDIYLLPNGYQALPLNNIGGVNLRPNVQNTATIPVYVGNKYIAKAKDYFNEDVSGVVTYRSKVYKLEPTKLPDLQDGGLQREVSKIYPSEDKLTIASYNIENFSANNAAGETPDAKVEKIAKSFINEIHSPDIITLIEVQDNNGSVNDGTVSGVRSGEKLAAKIKQLGGKEYKYTEVAPVDGADGGKPGSNIRVAYLYNPQRVKLVEREAGSSTEAAAFKDGHLVKNPTRIDPTNPAFTKVRKSLAAEFEFKGEHIVVIANHLKSKLGDDAVYGSKQPAVQNTLAQRIEQAKLLNAFVKEGLKQNPNLKFVLTGDFNDFEFSETAKAVAGNELVNMMLNHDAADRYSYFYRGSNQSLDNIFVSKNIADKTVFSPVHINASFMEEHGRASDHDPVIAQLDFSKKDEPQPTPPSGGDSTTPPNKDDKPTKKRILPSTGTTGAEVAVVGIVILSATILWRKKVTDLKT
ncbi:endonuclease [Streptococcus sp. HMSC067A03]|uniref:endonuclease/exonuclease/phosphatase family protein n=1 Tax=Streptococcus sp. HMSC067A03 TaxID=1739467 RepID=UPI0008A49AD4|nr:endonuclease/exonuclease/phosphatase family protein [Streptococcus sp. HMSC067A03]OFP93426.1 endonuclease [Streptococcus sp. HMSC067A03]